MRKLLQFVSKLFIAAIVVAGIATSANAAQTIKAPEGASFRGEISANGQRFVCWRGIEFNAIGDFGARNWLHPFKDNAVISDGCTPLMGNGSFNLYKMADLANPDSRQALLVATAPKNGDRLDGKLGTNICRIDDPRGHGAKLLVTADPNDPRCVK